MAESEEELKSRSMKVKEESEEVGLKLNIEKTKTIWSPHLVTTNLFSMSVSLILFCRDVHFFHILYSTYKRYGICLSLSDLL